MPEPLLWCMLIGAIIGGLFGMFTRESGLRRTLIGASIGGGVVFAIYITGGLLIFAVIVLVFIRGGRM